MKYLLFALLAYLAYQFIFNLVIPVYRTSRKIKKGFREMHSRMQQESAATSHHPGNFEAKPASKPKAGDYIEFEEIK
ncbi:MAG: hypothetical protein HOP10_01905 [Chitinophagaceae bacterium]|nr:hypothetical protein [Chitinophagaceae bacterium]